MTEKNIVEQITRLPAIATVNGTPIEPGTLGNYRIGTPDDSYLCVNMTATNFCIWQATRRAESVEVVTFVISIPVDAGMNGGFNIEKFCMVTDAMVDKSHISKDLIICTDNINYEIKKILLGRVADSCRTFYASKKDIPVEMQNVKGVFIEPVNGQLIYLHYMDGGKPASTIMAVAIPAQMKTGVTVRRHVVMEIHRMATVSKHQKKGYMTSLIEKMKVMINGQVKYILTNWDDSTDDGRNFLLNRGFERRGKHLVWERGYEPDASKAIPL